MAVNLESLSFQFVNFSFGHKAEPVRPIIQRYLVLFEQGPGHLAGFVPDVPGCTATGHSMVEVREKVHEALELHLRGIVRKGMLLPEPSVGLTDVPPGTIAESMVVRLRLHHPRRAHDVVRPWPAR